MARGASGILEPRKVDFKTHKIPMLFDFPRCFWNSGPKNRESLETFYSRWKMLVGKPPWLPSANLFGLFPVFPDSEVWSLAPDPTGSITLDTPWPPLISVPEVAAV